MNNEIIIREIKSIDYDVLRKIFYNIRKEEFGWINRKIFLEDFDKYTEGEIIFVAEIKSEVVGFISVWVEDKFVHNLFISREHRKNGIGKKLINKVKFEIGTPLTLKCVKENQDAFKFYTRNNWKTLKENIGEEGIYYLMALDN